MKRYYIEYYTIENQKVGMEVSAITPTEAVIYARHLPNFKSLVCYPVEVF